MTRIPGETGRTSDQHLPSRAFVTGGTGGIGRRIVGELLRLGFHVDFSFHKSAEKVCDVFQENSHYRDRLRAVELDLLGASRGVIPPDVETSLRHTSVLVNNAATTHEQDFLDIGSTEWQRMLDVNLIAPAQLLRVAIPNMVERSWGRVVNIVSVGGQVGGVNQAHYAASKAGLISLTKSISNLYAAHGITSNAVSPGLIETPMTKAELGRDDGIAKVARIPVGRVGSVEDVAPLVGFLVTNRASYITGQVINVNGGTYLG